MTARDALALATREGARCLGRLDDIGSLEPGKVADVALWRIDDLAHAGIADPVAALVFGPARPVETMFVNGQRVVHEQRLLTGDEQTIARELTAQCERLLARSGRDSITVGAASPA